MIYAVVLMFSCNASCGAAPSSVILPARYSTLAPCNKAAAVWTTPAANPQGAVKSAICVRLK